MRIAVIGAGVAAPPHLRSLHELRGQAEREGGGGRKGGKAADELASLHGVSVSVVDLLC